MRSAHFVMITSPAVKFQRLTIRFQGGVDPKTVGETPGSQWRKTKSFLIFLYYVLYFESLYVKLRQNYYSTLNTVQLCNLLSDRNFVE